MSEERLTPDRVREINLNSSPETKEELMNSMITPQDGRSPIGKDLEDFYFLLENYGDIAGDQLFEGVEHDDLIKDDFELAIASARLLGRQIKNIALGNQELSTKLNQILVSRLKGFSDKEIDSMYQVREKGDTLVERFKLIAEVKKLDKQGMLADQIK
jgi:predicted nucleotidyltransferase